MEPIEEKQKGNIELKQRRNKYTVKFKLEVINMNKKRNFFTLQSKNLEIDRHTLRNWKNNEDQLKVVNNKEKLFRKNRSGFIYRNFSSTEEEDIFKFIKNARKNHKAVSTKSVVAFACTLKEEFAKKSPLTQLKWCYRFLKRY